MKFCYNIPIDGNDITGSIHLRVITRSSFETVIG